MKRSYYEVLGLERKATQEEIKKAYRKLVLIHHPDRSKSKESEAIFLEVTTAYEVLGDPQRRKEYDRLQAINEELRKKRASSPKTEPKQPPRQTEAQKAAAIKGDVERLVTFMSKGRFGDAEPLARKIITEDSKQPVPYAALGDIHRSRGQYRLASKMYAFAVQFDGSNLLYLRKHEETLAMVERDTERMQAQESEGRWLAPAVGVIITVVAACYVAISPEHPMFAKDTPISTWTMGLISMLFFSGAVMGATLSLSDYIDRFEITNTFGKLSPQFVFMALAIANIWLAGGLYLLVGFLTKGFVLSISRMLLSLVGVVAIVTMGAAASRAIDPYQVLLFGGTISAFGALLGWAFADGIRA